VSGLPCRVQTYVPGWDLLLAGPHGQRGAPDIKIAGGAGITPHDEDGRTRVVDRYTVASP
jgi:hypothetical protein